MNCIRKHGFFEKNKYSMKLKMDSLWTPRNITSLDGSCYEAIDSSISQNTFSYLKMSGMQYRENITVEDNKKIKMNITTLINIYTNIYTCIICDENDSNKNNSINAILQQGCFVDKNLCVVFPPSGFLYLILCPRQCKWKVTTTYLAMMTKNN